MVLDTYLTVDEVLNAPTGIDWTALPKPGDTDAHMRATITTLLKRATGMVDAEVKQKLQATIDTESWPVPGLRATYTRQGLFSVFPKYSPIRAVTSMSFAFDGVTYTTLPWNVQIPLSSQFLLMEPSSWAWSGAGYGGGPGYRGWLKYTYVDGYPNALLTVPVIAGDTLLPVDNPVGFLPNDYVTIYDSTAEEDVQIASNYVAGANPLLLTAGVINAHAAGVRVSELPPAVREATLAFAIDLAMSMGQDVVLALTTGDTKIVEQSRAGLGDAKRSLIPYARVL